MRLMILNYIMGVSVGVFCGWILWGSIMFNLNELEAML